MPLPLSAAGNFRVRELLVGPIVVLLSIALTWGCFDTKGIFTIPRRVHINYSQTGHIQDKRTEPIRDTLRVTLDGPVAAGVGVRLTSRFWANRQHQELSWDNEGRPYMDLPLDRLPDAAVDDQYDGEVEVIYRPSVLWRRLPAVVVERAPLRWLLPPRQDRR